MRAAARTLLLAYPPHAAWADDPLRGEHTQDSAPGTAFEDRPADFYCPACGASKSAFELIEDRAWQRETPRPETGRFFETNGG